MTERIVWTDLAIEQMAELWLSAPDSAKFNATVKAIESHLKHRTAESVEPVSEGLYRYVLSPLQVLFYIEEATRVVQIVAIKSV